MNCLELFVHIWCFRWLLSTAKVDVMPVLPSLRHVIAGIWMRAQKCRSCTTIQNLYSCLTTGLTVFFIITSEAISLTATILAFDDPGLALGSFFIFFFPFMCSFFFT